MAVAKTFTNLKNSTKDIYLYDTFEGMTKPGDIDISFEGMKAEVMFSKTCINDKSSQWCYASLEDVKEAMFNTGYDKTKIHFIKGLVEDTIPGSAPEIISLLRLDTDWYESTKHELIHLFPWLSKRGVIIIDDYGEWQGCKKATDEYVLENNICLLLNRIDYTGRIGIKL